MAYDIEKNKWHPGLQVAAAQLYIPYIDQALNMRHSFKSVGHFGDGDMISEADYQPKWEPFIDLLIEGGYAVQKGHLMATGNKIILGGKAISTLAPVLGLSDADLIKLLDRDLLDVGAGKSPTGYKQVIDIWGKIPHDYVQSQWVAGDQADAWVAARPPVSKNEEGATFGSDGTNDAGGGSLLLWAGLLGLAALGLRGSL